ncbi:MAG: hypothetical protein AAGU10_08245 [Methanosarcina mazei]
MSNNEQEVQEKIEDELFGEYDKALDRIFSLVKFIFLIIGFYVVVLCDMHGELDKEIFTNAPDPVISTISILIGFVSIITALFSLLDVLTCEKKYKFKEINGSIQLLKETERKENNFNVFLEIKRLNSRYKSSIYLIALSLILFWCYIRPSMFYLFLVFVLPISIFIILSKLRKFIKATIK